MKLYLEMDGFCETTREAETDDQWDRGDTCKEWNFGRLSATGNYDGLEVGNDFKIGDHVFVVVAVWSTGDTFGHDENSYAEVMAIYNDIIQASEAERMLNEAKGPVLLPHGYEVRYLPWAGYFDSLGYITVIERTIYP